MTKNDVAQYLDMLIPDPKCELIYHTDYELLMAIVLSAQSTDKRVNMVTKVLFDKYPTLEAIAEADLNDLEVIIKSVGSYHKKSIFIKEIAKILINDYDVIVPRSHDALVTFPGVGRKSANVFLSEYYHDPYIAVDTHVERVCKRLGLANRKDNVLTIEKKLMKCYPKADWGKRHLQLVLFGRYYCKAIKPLCSECKLKDICKEKKKNY